MAVVHVARNQIELWYPGGRKQSESSRRQTQTCSRPRPLRCRLAFAYARDVEFRSHQDLYQPCRRSRTRWSSPADASRGDGLRGWCKACEAEARSKRYKKRKAASDGGHVKRR